MHYGDIISWDDIRSAELLEQAEREHAQPFLRHTEDKVDLRWTAYGTRDGVFVIRTHNWNSRLTFDDIGTLLRSEFGFYVYERTPIGTDFSYYSYPGFGSTLTQHPEYNFSRAHYQPDKKRFLHLSFDWLRRNSVDATVRELLVPTTRGSDTTIDMGRLDFFGLYQPPSNPKF